MTSVAGIESQVEGAGAPATTWRGAAPSSASLSTGPTACGTATTLSELPEGTRGVGQDVAGRGAWKGAVGGALACGAQVQLSAKDVTF